MKKPMNFSGFLLLLQFSKALILGAFFLLVNALCFFLGLGGQKVKRRGVSYGCCHRVVLVMVVGLEVKWNY